MTFRICEFCGQERPSAEFKVRQRGKTVYRNRCRKCWAAYMRDLAARSGDPGAYYRAGNLRKYGITVEDFDRMLADQGGVCAVCKGPALGKGRFHVDHDHATGAVRGLLCHKCNVTLGMVQDDPDHLLALVAYLNRQREGTCVDAEFT